MSGEQVDLVDDGFTGPELRAAEYGGTPTPLISQALVHLQSALRRRFVVKSFVEPGSGPAPFCRVVGTMWPDSIRYAVDVREGERPHASRNATCFVASMFEDFASDFASMDVHEDVRHFDLLATNPPFSCAFEWAERGVELARDVLLLLPDDWHKRTKARVKRFVEGGLRDLVVGQMQIAGRIAFYGGSRTDRVSYSWWHFSKVGTFSNGGPSGSWPTWMLPMLPAWARRWQGCRPGMEET